jgi:hypothetical protein
MKSVTITLTEEEIVVFSTFIEHTNYLKHPGDDKWNKMSFEDKEMFVKIQTHMLNILKKISKSKLK